MYVRTIFCKHVTLYNIVTTMGNYRQIKSKKLISIFTKKNKPIEN